MKKVIFISAIALAAAVSCTKSEVVDTKFNEQIGFETYLGRDAQTKAAVTNTDNIVDLGLYGFYTGNDIWGTSSTANLWDKVQVTSESDWTPSPDRYWTNDTDKYTFLAYSPYTHANLTAAAGANPTITYTVAPELGNQVDLLYSNNNVDIIKPASGSVTLTLGHTLARLSVKAKADGEDVQFLVKEVSIAGAFNTTGTFNLRNGVWTATTPAAATYTFYSDADNKTALTAENTDYAGTDNYLMMIPTNFSAEGATAATLTVKYTTFYQNQESTVNTVTFPVATNFAQGKAYTINLAFAADNVASEQNKITFTVSVDEWGNEEEVEETEQTQEPEDETPGTQE